MLTKKYQYVLLVIFLVLLIAVVTFYPTKKQSDTFENVSGSVVMFKAQMYGGNKLDSNGNKMLVFQKLNSMDGTRLTFGDPMINKIDIKSVNGIQLQLNKCMTTNKDGTSSELNFTSNPPSVKISNIKSLRYVQEGDYTDDAFEFSGDFSKMIYLNDGGKFKKYYNKCTKSGGDITITIQMNP